MQNPTLLTRLLHARILVASLVVLVFISLATGIVLAWTYLGNFSPTTAWWGPDYGEKTAQIADDGGTNRYIDAEATNFHYPEDRLAELRHDAWKTGIVFHVFRKNTNCFVNVTETGYWWTNVPSPVRQIKTANCASETFTGKNEVRIWIDPNLINSVSSYYGGQEFKDRKREGGGGRLAGEVDYDAYTQPVTFKQWMGKFYFLKTNALTVP